MKYFLIFLFFSQLCANRQTELFLEGNQYYQNKDFDKALKAYQAIENKGPVAYYNQALCYLYQEDNFNAYLFFKKAQFLGKKRVFNLATKQLDDLKNKVSVQEEPYLLWYAHAARAYLSFFLLQIIALFLWYAFLYCCYYYTSRIRCFLFGGSFLLVLSLIILIYYAITFNCGIAVDNTIVRVGPDSNFEAIAEYKKGDVLTLVSKQKEATKNWYKIKNNNTIGWVDPETIFVIT